MTEAVATGGPDPGVIIAAAGRGIRAGGNTPKQWRPLAGLSVIRHTLRAFAGLPVILVIHPDDRARAEALGPGIDLVEGGATRTLSVRAGLLRARERGFRNVLIHDGARPLVSAELIARVAGALAHAVAAAPALAIADALWRGHEGHVTATLDRTNLFRAQTPQGFRLDAILAAHHAFAGSAADDVEIARAAGLDVAIVEGEDTNLKLTHAADFTRAERILRGRRMDIRTGHGFDVHAFAPGDHVRLCGVRIPHDRALAGHSDADAGLHALTDAILGALALGDIGGLFPSSDPAWKGADSATFLRHAAALATGRGYAIGNLDVTLICEQPRIGPHIPAMRERIADILAIGADRASVKATTTDHLGFAGRREGIAALATALLVRE